MVCLLLQAPLYIVYCVTSAAARRPFRSAIVTVSHRKKYTVYKKATENYFIPLTLSRRKSSNYFAWFRGRPAAKHKTPLQKFLFALPAPGSWQGAPSGPAVSVRVQHAKPVPGAAGGSPRRSGGAGSGAPLDRHRRAGAPLD